MAAALERRRQLAQASGSAPAGVGRPPAGFAEIGAPPAMPAGGPPQMPGAGGAAGGGRGGLFRSMADLGIETSGSEEGDEGPLPALPRSRSPQTSMAVDSMAAAAGAARSPAEAAATRPAGASVYTSAPELKVPASPERLASGGGAKGGYREPAEAVRSSAPSSRPSMHDDFDYSFDHVAAAGPPPRHASGGGAHPQPNLQPYAPPAGAAGGSPQLRGMFVERASVGSAAPGSAAHPTAPAVPAAAPPMEAISTGHLQSLALQAQAAAAEEAQAARVEAARAQAATDAAAAALAAEQQRRKEEVSRRSAGCPLLGLSCKSLLVNLAACTTLACRSVVAALRQNGVWGAASHADRQWYYQHAMSQPYIPSQSCRSSFFRASWQHPRLGRPVRPRAQQPSCRRRNPDTPRKSPG